MPKYLWKSGPAYCLYSLFSNTITGYVYIVVEGVTTTGARVSTSALILLAQVTGAVKTHILYFYVD